jgi:hypothetical protein
MRRLILAICLAVAGGSGMGVAAHPALAATLCVGSGPGCFSAIQAALDAAHKGDVIHIGPGTFAGGITITKSVTISGAGAGSTSIQGGGPVVTIGTADGTEEPTVSITGVTVTGGSNTSTPRPFIPQGGGLMVLALAAGGPGATVTITDSRITGNRAAAASSVDCGPGCTFSGALAGGILNEGALTLRASSVTDNSASVATNAACVFGSGGGIHSDGPVTLEGSTISGNTLTVSSSTSTPLPGCDFHGVGGGLHLTPSAVATVRGSVISGNSVTTTGSNVVANPEAGGIDDDGSLLLQDSTVSNNRITASVTSTEPTAVASSDGGAMEIDGAATIKNTKITGNSVVATSPAGIVGDFSPSPASVGGALVVTTVQPVTVTDSVIRGNTVSATTTSGTALVAGGGIFNCSTTLTLQDTTVSSNSGSAQSAQTPPAPGGAAQGGGIWNGPCGGVAPAMTLIDSAVTHNSLTASPGIPVQGGGVFNLGTLTLRNSVISGNTPDQCYGC